MSGRTGNCCFRASFLLFFLSFAVGGALSFVAPRRPLGPGFPPCLVESIRVITMVHFFAVVSRTCFGRVCFSLKVPGYHT